MRKWMALLVLAVAGCETAQGDMDKYLPAYQGQPVAKLFERWGIPTRSLRTDAGTTIYIYENSIPDRSAKVEIQADTLNNMRSVRCFGVGDACVIWMRMLR